jgi:hypothetical protein
MLGSFHFVPNYILAMIIFFTLFDAIALYFSGIDKKIMDRNPDVRNLINTYLKYTKPQSSASSPVWFFFDRFVAGTLFACFALYCYMTGFCK